MARKGTSGYNRPRGLSIEQRNAIDLLVQGKSDQETADAVGVNRVTVTKWRNYDPWFQAELNQRRQDVWGGSVDRLRGLLPRALERIEQELDGPNGWRVALHLLKIVGLDTERGKTYGTIGIGPSSPEKIIDEEVRRRRGSIVDILGDIGEPTITDADRRQVLADFERRSQET
jgi:hypothetical protein